MARLKVSTKTVFKFTELSSKAKDNVSQWLNSNGYNWSDDAIASLKALAAHFDGKLVNYSIDFQNCSHSSAKFSMPKMTKREIAVKLKELGTFNRKTLRGHGDCKLTGYCADESAIDGFRFAFTRDKVIGLNELMQSAFDTWLKAAQADMEYQCSEEAVAESCEANDYEFDEHGNLA